MKRRYQQLHKFCKSGFREINHVIGSTHTFCTYNTKNPSELPNLCSKYVRICVFAFLRICRYAPGDILVSILYLFSLCKLFLSIDSKGYM